MKDFKELEKEVYALFDTAELTPYKSYNIFSRAHLEVGNINNVRSVWRGDETPNGNKRELPLTQNNYNKLKAIRHFYETQLHVARKEIKEIINQ